MCVGNGIRSLPAILIIWQQYYRLTGICSDCAQTLASWLSYIETCTAVPPSGC